jgi:hypothetical protein
VPLAYVNTKYESFDQRYLNIAKENVISKDSKVDVKYILRNRLIALDKKLNKTIFQDGFDMDIYYQNGIKHILKVNSNEADEEEDELDENQSSDIEHMKHLSLLWPMVDAVSPDWGETSGGTEVKIIGRNFVPRGVIKSKWNNHVVVMFGANKSTEVNVVSETEIRCKSPAITSIEENVWINGKAKKKDGKRKYLPLRIKVIVDCPQGYFKSNEHVDGDVRLHNDYAFTYFPPEEDIYEKYYDEDSSDDFENTNSDYDTFVKNSAVGKKGKKKKQILNQIKRINWSFYQEKTIEFPEKKLGLELTENFIKSLDRNPFQGDGLLVDKIQEKHCANPVECRKISGWYLSSIYNTVTKKRISIIEDALDFDHVVDAIIKGEMKDRPIKITFQNINFTQMEKENDLMRTEDLLAKALVLEEEEGNRLMEIELMTKENTLADEIRKVEKEKKMSEQEVKMDVEDEKVDEEVTVNDDDDTIIPWIENDSLLKSLKEDNRLDEWQSMMETISSCDVIGKPFRHSNIANNKCLFLPKAMPSNSSFTCEYPTDWEEVPEVLEYHSNLDSLGYNISSTMRTMEMLTILHNNASSSQNVEEMDEDEEDDLNEMNSISFSSPILNNKRIDLGNDYVDVLFKSAIPQAQIGRMPGCFQRHLNSYIGFLSQINDLEVMNEQGTGAKKRKRRHTHYFDIIGLNINGKSDLCPSRFGKL